MNRNILKLSERELKKDNVLLVLFFGYLFNIDINLTCLDAIDSYR